LRCSTGATSSPRRSSAREPSAVGSDRPVTLADGIATITFDRPDKLNALTFAMCDAFVARLDEARDESTEALRALRSHPETAGIPVMAVTASVMPMELREILAHGFDGYVSKPIDGGVLMTVVAGATGG
jgi:CheY-like chemotaxis protein